MQSTCYLEHGVNNAISIGIKNNPCCFLVCVSILIYEFVIFMIFFKCPLLEKRGILFLDK